MKPDCPAVDSLNNVKKDFFYRWGILPLWLLLTATVFFRSLAPIDETRYLSVAWEMWLRGDFWVPYLNGQAYSHKPPLLFWLFQSGWAVFGVNDWWPKLVGPLCALANLLLTRKLAEKLWPAQAGVALIAPWILIATLLWTLFAASAMFDILLTGCVLLGMLGLCGFAQDATFKNWACIVLSIGFGLLAKGPVIFLHLLPAAGLVFFWSPGGGKACCWYGGLTLASLAGAAIALGWAIPAAMAGGDDYAKAILWHQTANRAIGANIHARPLFWYLPFLPLVLFPWIVWPRFWKNLRHAEIAADSGLRFCLVWLLATFFIFSLLPSKQIHYLIPMLPAFALLVARVLVKNEPSGGLPSDSLVPAAFGVAGVFLILLPQVPGLSKLHWVQTVEAGWGLGVLAIAAVLAAAALYLRKLPVAAVSTALVVAVFAGFVFFFRYTGLAYDLRPAALQVKLFNETGVPCAFVGNYQGQLHFLGRLTQPLQILSAKQAAKWVKKHADGYLISLEKDKPANAAYMQPHREYWLVFRRAGRAAVAQLKPL